MTLNRFSLFLSFFVSGCFNQNKVTTFSGSTMGTTYSIKVASSTMLNHGQIERGVESTLKKVSDQMSTYQDSSEITAVNKAKAHKKKPISLWFYQVLKFSLELAEETNGFFDPTIGPLVNLWGFGPVKSIRLPSPKEIYETRKHVGFKKVRVFKEQSQAFVKKDFDKVFIDLSSSAKGFGVDQISLFLSRQGLENHLVEIGGEIRASGTKFSKPWLVAVERPEKASRSAMEALKLKNLSIATSGSYRNFFTSGKKRYSHTLSQKTGEPIEHKLISASVVSKNCMKADAYATALMSLGPKKAMDFAEQKNLAVYLIFEEEETGRHKTYKSDQFLELFGEAA